jgi:hypothetical protein
VSRIIDRAPLALTSDGEVLLNVARFDVPKKIEEVVLMALRQRGAIFIGVALSSVEARRLLDDAAIVLPNVTGLLVGRRQRGTLRRR